VQMAQATKGRCCVGSFAVQSEEQMGLLMPVREPYVSHISSKSQLSIRMHQEQAVQQSITKQAASTGFANSVA